MKLIVTLITTILSISLYTITNRTELDASIGNDTKSALHNYRFSDIKLLCSNNNINVFYWLFYNDKPYLGRICSLSRTDSNYHLIIKLLLGNQIEPNPGPRTPRWPCGACGKAVTWKSKALECDT